jgi:hypothetical protein
MEIGKESIIRGSFRLTNPVNKMMDENDKGSVMFMTTLVTKRERTGFA